jgi:isopenicillin N synthase-like dioxygenase
VLDREPGAGGLQVFVTAADDPDGPGVWQDAPYHPDALTVNIGDLLALRTPSLRSVGALRTRCHTGSLAPLAHGTGLRWSSGRHRVLPPQAAHPDEELMSLVFFYELDHDAVVTPLAPPVGRRVGLEAVVSAPFIRQRLDAISVG